MKFAILTFGCRVNQADSLAIENGLRAGGAEPATPADADVIVVNSCSVTASADQGTRQAIRRVARTNPEARLVVTGCYATRRPDEIASLPGVVRIVANSEKDAIASILTAGCGSSDLTTEARFAPDGEGPCGLRLAPGAGGRTAFTLRVQTGCDERCSYCIIPKTRGASVSRPVDWVVEQLTRACEAGYREVTLTGVHLGDYGRGLRPRRSLADLLEAVARISFDVVVRIGSLEPMDCTARVVGVVSTSARLAPAFHLPLQHASSRVLGRMRRPYTPEQYADLVAEIRRRLPDATIGSDVIAGFPGESEDDFQCLERFLERSPLTLLHVFPYSDRPGTEASRMSGKVDPAVIRGRAAGLRAISRRLSRRFLATQDGTERRALAIDDGTSALTANGLRVRLSERAARNTWVTVRLRWDGEELTGDVAPPDQVRSSVAAR